MKFVMPGRCAKVLLWVSRLKNIKIQKPSQNHRFMRNKKSVSKTPGYEIMVLSRKRPDTVALFKIANKN
ncbi:MAG: hypothetical protein ABJA66_19070 [Actinomycetota bacterium]